ncbi:MAG: hypothetical protein M1469_01760 [Bacteroidetes bacterium]|nr:hypothetical protein [Bacteroidota bacterium]
MTETIDGLDRFLAHAHVLLSDEGQLLLDSLDVRITDDPVNFAYHEANRIAGRYIGEIADARREKERGSQYHNIRRTCSHSI